MANIVVVDTADFSDFLTNLGEFEDEVVNNISGLLNNWGFELSEYAKRICPVNYGQLRDSIGYEIPDALTLVVGTNVKYAPYVELGTGKFATNGNGRPGWWVFVQGSDGTFRQKERKIYTHEEAVKIYWTLVNQGIPEDRIWITQGQKPQPFLSPTLGENYADIMIEIGDCVRDTMNGTFNSGGV